MKSILLFTLLLLIPSNAALADQNAADEYMKIMEFWEGLDDQEQMLLEDLPPHLEPCQETLAAMRKLGLMDRLLLQAAGKQVCDFNIDFSEGPGVLLPHLSPMLGLTRHTISRIHWQRMQGHDIEAARRLAGLYKLSFHMGQDGTLIGSLVAQSIFTKCDDSVETGIEAGTIGPDEARMLLSSLKGAEEDDAFGTIQSMRNEKEYFGGWVENQMEKVVQPDGSIELTDEVKDVFSTFEISNMEDWMEGFRSQDMDGYYRYMDESIETFEMIDPTAARAKQARIEAALVEGEYGNFARLLAPTLGKIMETMHKNEKALSDRVEQLNAIADGTIDPMDGANAAWRYIKAARMVDQLPRDDIQEEARSLILNELLVATLIEECTFPGFDEGNYPQPVVPPWSTGISQCFDLLLDQARKELDAGKIDNCIFQLVVGLEMAADLSGNPSLVDSIIAQDAVARILTIVDELDTSGQLDADQRRLLLEALRGIPARDPFGYMQAADQSRRLASTFVGYYDPLEKHAASFPTDPDDVLYTLAWSEDAVEPWSPYSFCWPLVIDWQILEGQVDGNAVLAARSHGVDAREAAKLDVMLELEPARNIALPTIKERRQEAATMLKEWKRRLDQ